MYKSIHLQFMTIPSEKISSQAYISKTFHEGKSSPRGTFVLKRNFSHVRFSTHITCFEMEQTKYLINSLIQHMWFFLKIVPDFTHIKII